MLKEIYAEKLALMPEITDIDTKEEFLYKAIAQKAAADLFMTFDTMAGHIQKGLNRA